MTHSFLSRLFAVCSLASLLALTGCGSGSTYEPLQPHRVVAFGDASSAVTDLNAGAGTAYGEAAASVRNTSTSETYTTIASRLAAYYGAVLRPSNAAAGVTAANHVSYATANARVADVVTQINTFLASGYSIDAKDLFIITVGNLDIYDNALAGNDAIPDATINALVGAVQSLTNRGAKYVLLVSPINMARTPWALNLDKFQSNGTAFDSTRTDKVKIQALSYDANTTCKSFQCKLTTQLAATFPATANGQKVLLADIQSYFNLATGTVLTGSADTYGSYGVSNPNAPACTFASNAMAAAPGAPILGSSGSLSITGCASTAADTNWATYAFADYLGLAPRSHVLLADYIYGTLMYRAGWR